MLIGTGLSSYAQNLELIGKEKPLKVNGGLSANQVFYASDDSLAQRDPYNYYLSGNLNFNLYGWSVPFTFTYSNRESTFTQPFNQYSLHPSYKWIRTHIGYTGMSFSPTTLNGHLFLGAGVELQPEGPVSGSAMFGRLKRAYKGDTSLTVPAPPEYERWGYGMKINYNLDQLSFVNTSISVSLFHAKDNVESLWAPFDSSVTPGENLVMGTQLQLDFSNNIQFTGEYATSSVTRDITATEESGSKHVFTKLGSMHETNKTSEFFSAYKMGLNYAHETFTAGLAYERIDPGYTSFGAYYFNNDFENITLNGSLNLLDNKVILGGSLGKQRDNLDNAKSSNMTRWVSSVNASYNSGNKLSVNASYTSFNSYTHIRSQFIDINQLTEYDNLDTLNFTQLSTSLNLNVNYVLSNSEDARQNLNVNMSYQEASEEQGDVPVNAGTRFYNFNTGYSYSMVPVSLTLVAAFNAGINTSPDLKTNTYGPTFSISKLMFEKKLRNTLSTAYNKTYNNGYAVNRILSLRGNSSLRIKKRHNINLNITYMNRKLNRTDGPDHANEFIATLGYSVGF